MKELESELEAIKNFAESEDTELRELEQLNKLYKQENASLHVQNNDYAQTIKKLEESLEMHQEKDLEAEKLIDELTKSVRQSKLEDKSSSIEAKLKFSELEESNVVVNEQKEQLLTYERENQRLKSIEKSYKTLKTAAEDLSIEFMKIQQAFNQLEMENLELKNNNDGDSASKTNINNDNENNAITNNAVSINDTNDNIFSPLQKEDAGNTSTAFLIKEQTSSSEKPVVLTDLRRNAVYREKSEGYKGEEIKIEDLE